MASLPNIRVNVGVPFPARVTGAGPISVLKSNGVWTIQDDFTKLAQHTPPQVQYDNTIIVTYNKITGVYETMSLTDLQDATQAGLPIGIELIHDAGGQPIQAGMKAFVEVPFAMTLNSVTLMLDQVGSTVMDIYKCLPVDFNPPTHPAAADKITNLTPPTIVGGVRVRDSTLTGWTTTFAKDDILGITCLSNLVATRVTLSMLGSRDQVP